MQDTVAWVESQRAASKPNFALGKDKFQRMLADTEMVTTPIEQLERIGRADLAANQKLLGEACSRYAPGQTIEACMLKMNANKPTGGAVAGARAQLAGLKRFIIDNDIVSIPGTGGGEGRGSTAVQPAEFAYINIPGPYEKGLPSVYYIAPPDPSWPKAEQDAFVPGEADLLFTSVHEFGPATSSTSSTPTGRSHVRPGVRRLRLRRRLGALHRGDDAGERRGRREPTRL